MLGYGPILPLATAALGAWTAPSPWAEIATNLGAIWGAIILVFVAGVRRGFGFGDPDASAASEIIAMLLYFGFGGLSLVLLQMGQAACALALLVLGFAQVAILDRQAAFNGDAPAHFARLRRPQMLIMAAASTVLFAHLMLHRNGTA